MLKLKLSKQNAGQQALITFNEEESSSTTAEAFAESREEETHRIRSCLMTRKETRQERERWDAREKVAGAGERKRAAEVAMRDENSRVRVRIGRERRKREMRKCRLLPIPRSDFFFTSFPAFPAAGFWYFLGDKKSIGRGATWLDLAWMILTLNLWNLLDDGRYQRSQKSD